MLRHLPYDRVYISNSANYISSTRHLSFAKMSDSKVLIYLLRRDLRIADNPIFHHISTQLDHSFTHLLPIYVFSAQQVEVSGFIPKDGPRSPYPEAKSQVGGFWRCGPHRAKFLSQSVWDLKNDLEGLGNGLCIRVGTVGDVMSSLLIPVDDKEKMKVGAIWMTGEEGSEEKREERDVKRICGKAGVDFKLWPDEKYLVDEYV